MADAVDNTIEASVLQHSKEILRECKPSENISINPPPETKKEKLEVIIPESLSANTETVFEKLDIKEKSSSDSAAINKGRPPDRNKSDIFSLDDKIPSANTIFSVNGTPSGRINRRRDEHSEVFPVGCMGCKEQISVDPLMGITVKESQSRPVSGKFSNRHRNPLTGAGVDSTDEVKRALTGRRKGLPEKTFH